MRVVIDACVLFQDALTGFLLALAARGALDPIWSEQIHREWMRSSQHHLGTGPEAIQARRDRMDTRFPLACHAVDPAMLDRITGLCRSQAQRKDAHVVAVAVAAGAHTIVTHNVKDFPARVLRPFGLRVRRPDDLCRLIHAADPDLVEAAAEAHRLELAPMPATLHAYVRLMRGPMFGLRGLARRMETAATAG